MTHCQSMPLNCFCGYKMTKKESVDFQIWGAANLELGYSNMLFVIEIDAFLINY